MTDGCSCHEDVRSGDQPIRLTTQEQQKRDYEMEASRKKYYAIQGITQAVEVELLTAMDNFPPMASYHEGLAIIQEEFEELKDLVWASKTDLWYRSQGYDVVPAGPKEKMAGEARQIAAMAMRFIYDLCEISGQSERNNKGSYAERISAQGGSGP